MTPERYHQIGELFAQALERSPEQRADFIDHAAGTDAGLRAEVERLLANYQDSGEFLSRPAIDVAAELLAQAKTNSAPGRQISHYSILSLLGVGGMGEVYLARDPRLNRKVALKVLPAIADADRLRRFEQEAFAASALNHPNILTIFEFGAEGETHFIASEFVQGETLRDKMQRDLLPLPETLDVTLQIASALQAAHEVGIIHRDIKPENIMVRPDGIIKVLDFGLAKLTEAESSPADADSTPTMLRTTEGAVVGTTRYMSPEQARGWHVDGRTDVFSLGVLLYELASGRPPFDGPSANDVIASILTQQPPALSGYLPAELQRLITKALAKDRQDRYQSAKELLLDLKGLKQRLEFEAELARSGHPAAELSLSESAAAHDPEGIRARTTTGLRSLIMSHKQAAGLTIAVLLAVATGLIFWVSPFGERKPLSPPATAKITPFTTFSGAADHPAFSPDGSQIAFIWDGGDGDNVDLYVKLIGAGVPLRLTTDPADDVSPSWSPDGRYLAFLRRMASENGLFIVPALGGTERKLGKTEPGLSRLAWSPDGKTLAIIDRSAPRDRNSIFLLSVDDGEKRRLTSPPDSTGDDFPAFSPDGNTLAFIRSSGFSAEDIYLISTSGGSLRRLTTDERRVHSLAWTADGGEIVFSSNRGGPFSLWRVAVTGGTPEWVAAIGQNAYSPAICRQGNRLAYNVSFLDSNIWRLDRSAGARPSVPTKLISSTRQDHSPQISPDGRRLVFVSDRSGNEEIWVSESDGSRPMQLTFFDGPVSGTPRWSPDGQQIVFDARPAGNSDIYLISAEGGKPRPLVVDSSHDVMPSWSRDGSSIYFCSNRSGVFQTWRIPAAGGEPVQVTQRGGFEAFESPDGKLLYYTKGRGPGELWQLPVSGGEEKPVPGLVSAGHRRYWAVQNEGIYFVAPDSGRRVVINFFSFARRRVTPIGVLEKDPLNGPPGLTVSPDGRWLLYAQADQSISDIMLVENFR